MRQRGFICVLSVMLLSVCGWLVAQDPGSAFAVPASEQMIKFELSMNGVGPVTMVVQDGDFARISDEIQTFAVAPIIRKGGTVDLMILEIGAREKGRETLHQRELIEGCVVGVEVLSDETGFAFTVGEIYHRDAYAKRPKSCDRCCIYCYGYRFCACAVSTECGSCCCTDCCEDWPPH